MSTQPAHSRRVHHLAVALVLAVVAAAVLVQTALAVPGGEAKNQSPFTRIVAVTPNDRSDVVSRYLGSHGITGNLAAEPKNELPFTRAVGGSVRDTSDVVSRYLGSHGITGSLAAEPKNEPPFTRPVHSVPVPVATSSSGFDWTLAGAIAAIVAALAAGLGAAMLVRHSEPRTA